MSIDRELFRQLIGTFNIEVQDICAAITRELLDLERLPPGDPAAGTAIDEVARMLHTLKGSAASVGLNDLSTIAHALEDLIPPLRSQPTHVPETTDYILKTLDVVLTRLRVHTQDKGDSLESSDGLVRQISEVVTRTRAQEPAATGAPTAASGPAVSNGAEQQEPEPAARQEHVAGTTWRVDAEQVLSIMKQVDRLREVGLRLADREREIGALVTEGRASRSADGSAGYRPISMQAIRKAVALDSEETSDIVATLEEGIKAISTMPGRTIIDPLQRAVRDVARGCRKEVQLSVVGGELAFDRRMLEALRGPLVHLLRNAVDHGIEPPETRRERGKDPIGHVVIRVERQGNMAFLEVEDDGAGLDVERIGAVALKRGLLSASALAAMNPQQLQQLVFHSGFSTRSQVSELSGRGIGLDAVKSALTELKGNVEIQSRPGHGCKFVLAIPVELGSSPAFLVRCLDEILGVPMMSIEATAAIRRNTLHRVLNEVRLPFRDTFVPLWDIGALLGLRSAAAPADGQPAVVVSFHGQVAAIAVDGVVGDSELPIRALPASLSAIPAYQGASMLAHGGLVLILNPAWLVAPERRKSFQLTERKSVLVVDDSLTARALHRSMLEAGGYLVHTVSSARQALEALEKSSYVAMVCDIAMEGLDGIGLTAVLRSRPEMHDLPIVLVSGREGEDDRLQGLEAGADGYLTKSECAQGRLLRELTSVLEKRAHS